jgi:hypothetical protein
LEISGDPSLCPFGGAERGSERAREGGIETEGGKGGTNGGGRIQEILPHFRLVEQRERGREGREREETGEGRGRKKFY